jgi:hypothetical protein
MSKQNFSSVSLTIDKNNTSIFFSILQQGFMVSAMVGCSLKSLLCDQFGVTPEYLSGRISTIFLNGKPVDDPESAIIKDGATLALSGAMPGLVGATFRSGGTLAVFRSSITHKNDKETVNIPTKGTITLKLFNLLVSEMGPAFLERGFMIKTGILIDFLDSKKENLQIVFKSIKIDGQKAGINELKDMTNLDQQKPVHIIIQYC